MKPDFNPFNPDIDVNSQEFADLLAQWMAAHPIEFIIQGNEREDDEDDER